MSVCGKLFYHHPTGNDGLSQTASRDHSDDRKSLTDCQNDKYREFCMCLLLQSYYINVLVPCEKNRVVLQG